eukprot:gb/GFBE01069225.1/.p1 GENE.gb/GFBE01069225.1/~~gb/GFBE01069225.1/.p1  ORF type:complete len:181 (+),score=33.54 gb/GFBE01069225.1/:1-543(+)
MMVCPPRVELPFLGQLARDLTKRLCREVSVRSLMRRPSFALVTLLVLSPWAAGEFHCGKQPGIGCSIFPCPMQYGPVDCVEEACRCLPGYCVVQREDPYGLEVDVCECRKHTGASCGSSACPERHGPTKCVAGECVCKDGYCADEQISKDGEKYGKCIAIDQELHAAHAEVMAVVRNREL